MPDPAAPAARQRPQWLWFALIFAALSAALAAWYVLALKDDDVALYRDLTAADAASVAAALDGANIPYHIGADGALLVPSARQDEARRRLSAAHAGPAAVQGFELFDSSDMGLTDFGQKIKYQRALQGELERTIMMMDGVASARVHISEPDHTLFDPTPETAKAAVTLVTRTSAAETPERVAGIRRLIAAAVPDLSVSDVVVLDANGDILSSDVNIEHADAAPRTALQQTPPQLFGPSDPSLTDLVTAAVGRAIPHTRFSITMEPAAQPAPGSPAPFAVSVTTDAELAPIDVERVRGALTGASQAAGRPLSTIVFRTHAAIAPQAAPIHAAPRPPAGTSAPADLLIGGALILILLGLALGFWFWRTRAAKTLTDAQRQSFAAELKAAMAAAGEQREPA